MKRLWNLCLSELENLIVVCQEEKHVFSSKPSSISLPELSPCIYPLNILPVQLYYGEELWFWITVSFFPIAIAYGAAWNRHLTDEERHNIGCRTMGELLSYDDFTPITPVSNTTKFDCCKLRTNPAACDDWCTWCHVRFLYSISPYNNNCLMWVSSFLTIAKL